MCDIAYASTAFKNRYNLDGKFLSEHAVSLLLDDAVAVVALDNMVISELSYFNAHVKMTTDTYVKKSSSQTNVKRTALTLQTCAYQGHLPLMPKFGIIYCEDCMNPETSTKSTRA
jgi:hypothetical protein